MKKAKRERERKDCLADQSDVRKSSETDDDWPERWAAFLLKQKKQQKSQHCPKKSRDLRANKFKIKSSEREGEKKKDKFTNIQMFFKFSLKQHYVRIGLFCSYSCRVHFDTTVIFSFSSQDYDLIIFNIKGFPGCPSPPASLPQLTVIYRVSWWTDGAYFRLLSKLLLTVAAVSSVSQAVR